MTIFQSIVLGIIQGLTEFLPISSSGHLVIVSNILQTDLSLFESFLFDVLVQVATLIAVIVYFWKDLLTMGKAMWESLINISSRKNHNSRVGWLLIFASIPAAIAGLLIKDIVVQTFSDVKFTGFSLIVTALLLVVAERFGKRNRTLENMVWLDALWIGFFQVISILPGVSRSGSTISGGMTRNFDRQSAARFSFLMSIPIMLAAGLLASVELVRQPFAVELMPVFIPGFISAAVTGYLSIKWLLKFLINHSLYVFAVYCFLLGVIVILI